MVLRISPQIATMTLWTLRSETQREDLSWKWSFRSFSRQRKFILRVDEVLLENKSRQSSRPRTELLIWPTYKCDLEKGYLEGAQKPQERWEEPGQDGALEAPPWTGSGSRWNTL